MNRILIFAAAAIPILADASLKGAALLVLAGGCVLVMRRVSASARHMVWLAAMVALLIVPVLSVVLPGWRVLPRWTVREAVVADVAMPRAAEKPALTALPTERPTVFRPAPPLPVPEVAGVVRPSVPVLVASESVKPIAGHGWLLLIWAAGCVVLVLRLAAAHVLLRRSTRRCEPANGALVGTLEAARVECGVRQSVRLLMDKGRTIPVVWGIFRPQLLLPAEAERWNATQLRSVLLHELAHLRRRDPLTQLLTQLACALHWFNPLVWLAAWRLHVERERACDDLVLARGVKPSAYAEHLLRIATQLSPARWTQACGLAMARKSSIEGRLHAVLSDKINRRSVTRALTAAALMLGAIIAVPLAMLRAADEEWDPPHGAHIGGNDFSAVCVHDGKEASFVIAYRGAFDSMSNGGSNAKARTWTNSGTITLKKPGVVLSYHRVHTAPGELSLTTAPSEARDLSKAAPPVGNFGQKEYDLAKGRVFLLSDDATVRQLDLPTPLVTSRENADKLAQLIAAKIPLENADMALPKHKDARALYELWQPYARLSGDIPGALIGKLAAAVKVFIGYNPTWETVPKLNEILPRLDATRDWKAADAIALLDELAAVQDSPLQTAAEKMTAATIRQGEVLPDGFAGLAWGETQPNGLRAAWVLEPGAAEHRIGTALKARLLVQNTGTIPVMARVPTWHQGGVSARDAAGGEVEVSGIDWTTMARLVPVCLAPGEYVEINAPGVGLGKDAGRGPWAGPRVGSNVLGKDGAELILTHGPIPLDGGGVGMREDAPHIVGSGWWQAHIKERLSRELPLPSSGAKRTHLLDRAVRDLFATTPTADEIAAFATDQSDGAFDALVQRLAARVDRVEFSGSLPTARVKFRVLPADPTADETPRVVLGPGEYPLSGGTAARGAVMLKIVGRPVGDRRTNDAQIQFEAVEATGKLPPNPHKLEIPDGWGTWAIVCRPGEGFIYVLHKGGARKIDCNDPAKVTDMPATVVPVEFRDEVKRQLDIAGVSAEVQAEVFGRAAPPASETGEARPPERTHLWSDKYAAVAYQREKDVRFILVHEGFISTGIGESFSPMSGKWSIAGNIHLVDSKLTEAAGKNVDKRVIAVKHTSDEPGTLYLDGKAYALGTGRVFVLGDSGEPFQTARSMVMRTNEDMVKIGDMAMADMKQARRGKTPDPKSAAAVQPVTDGKSAALVLREDGREPIVILTGRAMTMLPNSNSRSGGVTMEVATSEKTMAIGYSWPEDAQGFLDLHTGGGPRHRFDLSRGRVFYVHFEKLEFAAEFFQVPAGMKVPAIDSPAALTRAAAAVTAWYDSCDDRARWECSRVVVPESAYKSGQPLGAAADKIVWGEANEVGLRLGIGGLEPGAAYPVGQVVPVAQYIRNDSGNAISLSPTQVFNEGVGGELVRKSDGKKFAHQRGYPRQGFFDRVRLAPGTYIQLVSGPLSTIMAGKDGTSPLGMDVMAHGFTVVPGEYSLQLTHGIGQFLGRPANFSFGDPRAAPGLGEWTGVLTSAVVSLRLADEQVRTAKAGDSEEFRTQYMMAFDKGVIRLRHYKGYPNMAQIGGPWEDRSRDWKVAAADGEYTVAWAAGGNGIWVKDASGITHLIVKEDLTENGKWTLEQAVGGGVDIPAGVRAALQLPPARVEEKPSAEAPAAGEPVKPQHESAQALFRKWQAGARTDGEIPGGLIGELVRTMDEAVKQISDAEVSAKLAALRPRLDASRDWTQAEAVALLDEIAAITTAPVSWADDAMQSSLERVVRRGEPLPKGLESAAWGAPAVNGLRAAWLLEPRAEQYPLGSVLKARVLFHNAGKEPIVFETATWHQDDGHTARDEKGAGIAVKATWFTGITPMSRFRLEPGEYCEVSGHGVAIGAGEYRDEHSTGAVGAIIEAKEGDTVILTHVVDAAEGGWTRPGDPKDPGQLIDQYVRERILQFAPMPKDRADRELIIRRTTPEILGVLPTLEEIGAFVADDASDGLEKLAARLAKQRAERDGSVKPWSGKLPTGETKFRVVAADPDEARRPRVANAPGRYVLADSVHLQVRQVTEGDRRVNSSEILFFGPDPTKESVHKPYGIALPDGAGSCGMVWVRGAGELWVMENGLVRRYEFRDPGAVKEVRIESGSIGDVPEPLREAMKQAFGELAASVQQQRAPGVGARPADDGSKLSADDGLDVPIAPDQAMKASGLDAESRRGLWTGSKDGVSVELRFGDDVSWRVNNGEGLGTAAATTLRVLPDVMARHLDVMVAHGKESWVTCGRVSRGAGGGLQVEIWPHTSAAPFLPRISGLELTKRPSEVPGVSREVVLLDSDVEGRLVWGETVNGLRAALVRVSPGSDAKPGTVIDLNVVVQNVSERSEPFRGESPVAGAVPKIVFADGTVKDAGQNILDILSAVHDVVLPPRHVVVMSLMSVLIGELGPDSRSADPNRSVGYSSGKLADGAVVAGLTASLSFGHGPANAWKGTMMSGALSLEADLPEQKTSVLDASAEAQLEWGEAVNGLRGALIIRSPGTGKPEGIYLAVQNVADAPLRFVDEVRDERLRALYLGDAKGVKAVLSNAEPTMTDVTIEPRGVVYLNMMLRDASAEIAAVLIGGIRKDSRERWHAALELRDVPDGAWKGKLTTGETSGAVREGGRR